MVCWLAGGWPGLAGEAVAELTASRMGGRGEGGEGEGRGEVKIGS